MRIRFTDMAYGGDAVGRDPDSGVAVFAWPGISGEQAEVTITSKGKSLWRGTVGEVIDPSPLRAVPPCPYFGPCGGCQYQHIKYEGQLAYKHEILRSQLARTGGIAEPEAILREPISSPLGFGYRNSSHFAIEPQSRTLGYHTRDSHKVIAVSTCPISNAGVNRLIPIVNTLIANTAVPDATDLHGVMQVWKVALRSSDATGQAVVVFHTRPGGQAKPRPGRVPQRRSHGWGRPEAGPDTDLPPEANPIINLRRRDLRRALRALLASQEQNGLSLTAIEVMDDGTINLIAESRSAASMAAEAHADALGATSLLGRPGSAEELRPPLGAWVERLGGRVYWVAPDAFFQVNTGAAELLMREVADHVPAKLGLIVDAHAGAGTFALALADRARHVIGLELDGSAVASARWSAAASNISNVEFRQGKAEALFGRLDTEVQPDVVVLDPPRAGCQPQLLTDIAHRSVARIVYVSCDPSTLARDVKLLSADYELTSARVVDMFPQTFHLEIVAVLQRKTE